MRKLMLLAGVAALAAAIPALADDRGRGRGDRAENSERGGGHARAERGRGGDRERAERRGGGDDRAERRGGDRDRAERRGRGNDRAERRGRGNDRAERRLDRRERLIERISRDQRRDVREARRDERRAERRIRDENRDRIREARRDDRRDWRRWVERRADFRDRFADDSRRWRDERRPRFARHGAFCPPGLARQNIYCMPPGQLRRAQLIGQRLDSSHFDFVPERYRYRFADDERFLYRYAPDGTVFRFDRASGLVSNVVPLYATDLFLGEPLPLGYEVYNVPLAYRGYYPDTDDHLYRYDDGAIYEVDAETMLVEGIVALLTGGAGGLGGLGVGDLLPAGYDAYNVPLDYRDTYYDSDEAMYRYADGYIYEVDPETRLIESIISLLA